MKKFVIMLSAAAALSTMAPGSAFAGPRCDGDCRPERPERSAPAERPGPAERPAREPGDKQVWEKVVETIVSGASAAGAFVGVTFTPSKIGCGPNELC